MQHIWIPSVINIIKNFNGRTDVIRRVSSGRSSLVSSLFSPLFFSLFSLLLKSPHLPTKLPPLTSLSSLSLVQSECRVGYNLSTMYLYMYIDILPF